MDVKSSKRRRCRSTTPVHLLPRRDRRPSPDRSQERVRLQPGSRTSTSSVSNSRVNASSVDSTSKGDRKIKRRKRRRPSSSTSSTRSSSSRSSSRSASSSSGSSSSEDATPEKKAKKKKRESKVKKRKHKKSSKKKSKKLKKDRKMRKKPKKCVLTKTASSTKDFKNKESVNEKPSTSRNTVPANSATSTAPAIPPMSVVTEEITKQLAKRVIKPMTKEEWEKSQSQIRRVVSPTTGRTRLIRGDGEILEEIVSRTRHREINRLATKADGDQFQVTMFYNKTTLN